MPVGSRRSCLACRNRTLCSYLAAIHGIIISVMDCDELTWGLLQLSTHVGTPQCQDSCLHTTEDPSCRHGAERTAVGRRGHRSPESCVATCLCDAIWRKQLG
jgi:hypothetical protein